MKQPLAKTTALAAACLALATSGLPSAAQTASTMPMQAMGRGTYDGFGKTDDFDGGHLANDVYTHAWYCDTSIAAKSATGCELGTKFAKPPAKAFDPLYITVPLGFSVPPMQLQCPNGLICVDHPPTIDESAIGGPVNAATPGHDHFTTTFNGGMAEWWSVYVVGVKNAQTYQMIRNHRSFAYIRQLIAMKDPNVTAPIPTNLFLYFAVEQPTQ